MAISDNYVPTKTLGNGVTVLFTASWNVIASSFIRVFLENTTTGVQVLQTLDTDYSLSFSGSGLTVDFTIGTTPPSTEFVIIAREVALNQIVPYRTSQGFQGSVQENSFDKLTAMVQDQQDSFKRTLTFPVATSGITNPTLPMPVDDLSLAWDGTSGLIKNGPSTTAIGEAAAEAAAAAVSAAAALVSENAAAADLALTNADVVSTNADVVLTGLDVVATNADVVLTGLDVVATGNDLTATNADVVSTNADVVLTGLDVTAAASSASAASTSETNAALSAAKLKGTSTTSLAIGTGSKVFTTQAGKFFTAGTWLLVTSDADPANYMHGQVTTYSGATLTLNVTNTGGGGTLADWTIDVSGTRGAAGVGTGDMLGANNLSDVDDAPTSFDNIKQAASESATGVVEAATTAEMNAGTASKFPDAAKVKAHVDGQSGIAKFWVIWDAVTNVPVINASFNVTSITDDGAGLGQLNLTTGFSSADFAVACMASDHTGLANDAVLVLKDDDRPTATTVPWQTTNAAGTITDMALGSIVGYGDQ